MMHPYASQIYAEAFSDHYQPMYLAQANVWILSRAIPGSPYQDAIACYPRCAINPFADLAQDFLVLQQQQLISWVLVTDIFVCPPLVQLQKYFEHCSAFKTHYIHQTAKPYMLNKHHRYELKQAHKVCEVKIVPLQKYFSQWCELYHHLVARHNISGMQNFSEHYFKALLKMPELIAVGAFQQGELIAMHLWLTYEHYLYSHLAAASEQGYQARAAYAIYDFVVQSFGKEKTLDFGSGAGLQDDAQDGLARFKCGFANATATNYLCGKILNPTIYQQLCADKATTNFFPAYRK